jgi:hypothetical protein
MYFIPDTNVILLARPQGAFTESDLPSSNGFCLDGGQLIGCMYEADSRTKSCTKNCIHWICYH